MKNENIMRTVVLYLDFSNIILFLKIIFENIIKRNLGSVYCYGIEWLMFMLAS